MPPRSANTPLGNTLGGRTAAAAPRPPLDERAGLVNFVLAVWVGVVAAVIASLGGFESPDVLSNAWARLAALAASAGLLAWAFQTSSDWLARRLQLGVAASLVLHTLAAIGLANVTLETAADPYAEPDPPPMADQPSTPIMATAPRPDAEPRRVFDEPVETAEASDAAPVPTIDRRVADTEPTVVNDVPRPSESILPDEGDVDLAVKAAGDETDTYDAESPVVEFELRTRSIRASSAGLAEVDTDAPDTTPNEVTLSVPTITPSLSRLRSSRSPALPIDEVPAERLTEPVFETLPDGPRSVDANVPTVVAAETGRARSTGLVSRPPLVDVAPLEFDTPSPAPVITAVTPRPTPERARTTIRAPSARSVAESIATLAVPTASLDPPERLTDGPTEFRDSRSQRTAPPPGQRPRVEPQGRRAPRVASIAGSTLPTRLASPADAPL
ncbi:MAG: hypothetical protein AAGG46_04170, partial [Planctomycetota bacterium]